jgi:hypothetical protein
MKEIHLDNNQFLEDSSGRWQSTSSLNMASGKHIRFTAIDKNYSLSVTKPDGSRDSINVPTDVPYVRYEIKGKKGETYTFSIPAASVQATVPQMIVTVD